MANEIEVPFDVLRRAVESSHGHVDTWMYLCEVSEEGKKEVVLLTEDDLKKRPAGSAHAFLKTRKGRVGKANADEAQTVATLHVAGASETKRFEKGKADAMFWTESAIEKFFFPYYQRLLAPSEFADLQKSYYEPAVGTKPIMAFVHYPPSIYDDLTAVKPSPRDRNQIILDSIGRIRGE